MGTQRGLWSGDLQAGTQVGPWEGIARVGLWHGIEHLTDFVGKFPYPSVHASFVAPEATAVQTSAVSTAFTAVLLLALLLSAWLAVEHGVAHGATDFSAMATVLDVSAEASWLDAEQGDAPEDFSESSSIYLIVFPFTKEGGPMHGCLRWYAIVLKT